MDSLESVSGLAQAGAESEIIGSLCVSRMKGSEIARFGPPPNGFGPPPMDSSDSVSEFLLFKFNVFVRKLDPPQWFYPPQGFRVSYSRHGLILSLPIGM